MWWNTMSSFQQAMFIIACAGSVILILQIIFMLAGGADDGDVTAGGGMTDGDFSEMSGGMTDADLSFDGDGTGGGLPFDGGFSDGSLGGIADIADADIPEGGTSELASATTVSHGGGFGIRLLSLRSIVAFVAVGGWLGYTLGYMLDWYYALIIAAACGFAAACGMAGAIIGMEKMQSSGNINPTNAAGLRGTVYLTVPPARSGRGKVNILIQERYAEFEAVTDSDCPLTTTTEIKVIKHIGGNVLLVEKYKKPNITVENV